MQHMQDVQRVMQSEQEGMPTVQSMHPAQRFLNAGQVSQMLGIDRSTVYRMAQSGRLPATKIGPTVAVPGRTDGGSARRAPAVILLLTQRPAEGRY